jgi:hypothetical protein
MDLGSVPVQAQQVGRRDTIPIEVYVGAVTDMTQSIRRSSQEVVAQLIFRIISFVTAGLILVVGIFILAGPMVPSYVPSNYRIILGCVMILYGSYRIVMIWMKQRNARRELE